MQIIALERVIFYLRSLSVRRSRHMLKLCKNLWQIWQVVLDEKIEIKLRKKKIKMFFNFGMT